MALSIPAHVDSSLTVAETVSPTLTPARAACRAWDVLVIGAGPAGSLAARQLARRGISTLLVDRAQFPRYKVCGSCLSAAGLAELQAVGLGALPGRMEAPVLTRLRLASGRYQASLDIPAGAALSRAALDSRLIHEAIAYGADFLPGAHAQLDGFDSDKRAVYLRCGGQFWRARSRLVLIADGLGGRSLLGERGFGRRVRQGSRIGAGAICPEGSESQCYETGTIHMACGRGGYLGLVRIETGALDIAGAFDCDFVRESGGPAAAAERLLTSTGLPPISTLRDLAWHGTHRLNTAPLHVAAERLFVLGDAAGYVEPFTGEGITWALASARAVVEPAVEAVEEWRPSLAEAWESEHRSRIERRQTPCRLLMHGLRHPLLTRGVVALLQRWPDLARPLIDHIHRPFD